MPRSVIVLGMPRSGTSMVAGVFAHQGYFVAKDAEHELRTEDEHNPGGYWEADTFVEMNAEVLSEGGFPFHNTWLFEQMTDVAAERITRLSPLPAHERFVEEYESRAPWLWKDPRLCYTLPYWWPMVDPDRTGVVIVRRDPEAIYQSFVRLGWREPSAAAREDVLSRVDHHMRAARAAVASRSIPFEEVAYEDFKARPREIADKLSRLLDLSLTPGDLGYSRALNRSGARGRLATRLRLFARYLPAGVRAAAKKVMPRRLLRYLFPAVYRKPEELGVLRRPGDEA